MNRIQKFLFFILLSLLLSNATAQTNTDLEINKLSHPLFGIVIPTPDESIYLQKSITNQKNVTITGVKYTVGKINNKNIVLVISGIGKENSAIITARLISDFHPDLILASSAAGNINFTIMKNDVVIGKSVINADIGELTGKGSSFPYPQYLMNSQTNTALPLQFNLDNHLINFLTNLNKNNLPKIILGKIASSSNLPNPPWQVALLQKARVDVVEMEAAGIMQACWMFNSSCIVIRGVSNNPKQPFTLKDIQLAADNAAKVVVAIIANFNN